MNSIWFDTSNVVWCGRSECVGKTSKLKYELARYGGKFWFPFAVNRFAVFVSVSVCVNVSQKEWLSAHEISTLTDPE